MLSTNFLVKSKLFLFFLICFSSHQVIAQKTISEEKMLLNTHRGNLPTMLAFDYVNLSDFIQNNIRFPLKPFLYGKKNGKVIINYTISADGQIKNARVKYSSDKSFSKEVFRLLNATGKWNPGQLDSKDVNVKYSIIVDFEAPLQQNYNLRQAKVIYNGDLLPKNKIWYLADQIYLDQISILDDKYSQALLGSKQSEPTIIVNTGGKYSDEILRKLSNIDTNYYRLFVDDNQVDRNKWNQCLSTEKVVKFNIIAENTADLSKFKALLYTN